MNESSELSLDKSLICITLMDLIHLPHLVAFNLAHETLHS